MKILAELSEKSLGINNDQKIIGEAYTLRKSARAIVLNNEGLMALQHIEKYGYHKLPGGGMEGDEEIEETLHREIKEEVGCAIEILHPIGMVITYQTNLLHISYCYAVKVVGDVKEPNFDEGEIEANQSTVWLTPNECLETLKADIASKQQGDFILQRENIFLKEYLGV